MRSADTRQQVFFSFKSIENRIPQDHPICLLKKLVDGGLEKLSKDFDKLYSKTGRPSIPPEQLLRALLLQIFFSIRSERQLVEQLEYNMMFCWFVGLKLDDDIWNHFTFTKNRDCLLEGEIAQRFFPEVLAIAKQSPPASVIFNDLLGKAYTEIPESPRFCRENVWYFKNGFLYPGVLRQYYV